MGIRRRRAPGRASRRLRGFVAPRAGAPSCGAVSRPRPQGNHESRQTRYVLMPRNSPKTRAVFLDRDGVINRPLVRNGRPYPPRNVEELEILPGVVEAVERLRAAGFLALVVTNQPDVARGTTSRESVEAIHRALAARVPLDGVFACFHDDADQCACRKPAPGLLVEAAARFGVDLAASYMVGDRWRDVEAGRRAGCRVLWIDWGYDEQRPEVAPEDTVCSLAEAAERILAAEGRSRANPFSARREREVA